MGRYRVPSPTPSVGSDAPIPATLQEDEEDVKPQIPPGVGTSQLSQVFPETELAVAIIPKTESLDVIIPKMEPSDAVVPKPEPSDAIPIDDAQSWTFYVGNLHPRTTQTELYHLFKSEGGDTIQNIVIRSTRGCGVTVIPDEAMTPSDRCYASVRVKGFGATWEALNKYDPENPPMLHGLPILVKHCAADMPEVSEILERTMASLLKAKPKRTKRRVTRRLAMQKTELVIGGQQKPLVGPSRRIAQPKARPNPTGRAC